MIKLVLGIIGKPDAKDLKYVKEKILEYFPPIREILFVHQNFTRKKLYGIYRDLIASTSLNESVLEFRDKFVKRPPDLACLLIFSKALSFLHAGAAFSEERIGCLFVDKSPRSSKVNMLDILHELGHLFRLEHGGYHFGRRHTGIVKPCLMSYLPLGSFSSDKFCNQCKKRIARFK